MTDELRIGLQELLCKAHLEGDANFLKEGVRALSQAIMEMEVEDQIDTACRYGPSRAQPWAHGPSGRSPRSCKKPTSTWSLPARWTSR